MWGVHAESLGIMFHLHKWMGMCADFNKETVRINDILFQAKKND